MPKTRLAVSERSAVALAVGYATTVLLAGTALAVGGGLA